MRKLIQCLVLAGITCFGVSATTQAEGAVVVPPPCSPCDYNLTFGDGAGDFASLVLETNTPARSLTVGVPIINITGSLTIFGTPSSTIYDVSGPDPNVVGPNGHVDNLLYAAPSFFDKFGVGFDAAPILSADPPYFYSTDGLCIPGGGCSPFVNFDLGPPTQATPLPSSWGMLLPGIILFGLLGRGREKTRSVDLAIAC
jgi:hypothetical protein